MILSRSARVSRVSKGCKFPSRSIRKATLCSYFVFFWSRIVSVECRRGHHREQTRRSKPVLKSTLLHRCTLAPSDALAARSLPRMPSPHACERRCPRRCTDPRRLREAIDDLGEETTNFLRMNSWEEKHHVREAPVHFISAPLHFISAPLHFILAPLHFISRIYSLELMFMYDYHLINIWNRYINYV